MQISIHHWLSLGHELILAEHLFGGRGEGMVAAWLEAEAGRIDDPAFARLFSDHVTLPGIVSLDYAHRLIRTRHGALIGGIRFFGLDIARPFIEVIVHDFEDLSRLAEVVAAEWRAFAPSTMRLRMAPGVRPAGARADASILLARAGVLTPPPEGIALVPFEAPEPAMALVAERFAHMAATDPALRRDVGPQPDDELRALWEEGQLHGIRAGEGIVGLIAASPGQIGWIEGEEIREEVIRATHAGQGYAAMAQSLLPHQDPDTLLMGRIDARNIASRRTAERAGRRAVLDFVFLPLAP